MFVGNESIAGFDDEMAEAIKAETLRQEQHIELIASENYASPRVMQAQGGVLTNKYAEGYPHKRYYGGCEYVDQVEVLAIELPKHCLVRTMQTCNPILVPKRMRRFILGCSKAVIRYWE